MTQVAGIPFSRPVVNSEMIGEYLGYASMVLESGRITFGPLGREFEQKISERLGSRTVLAMNSGTAALHAAVNALHLKEGDEVLVPSDTFVSTVNAITYERLKPVFVDVRSDTFNISPESLQNRITSRSKAVMVVHLGGNPCDMDAIWDIAKSSHLALIEDAAQAFGANYRGRPCGTLGLVGALSFDHAKLITAAEGGAAVTEEPVVAERIKRFRNLGRSELGYEAVETIGYNYRLSELHAALGLVSERYCDSYLKSRIGSGLHYRELLSKLRWITLQSLERDGTSSFHATLIKISKDSPVTRDNLMMRLAAQGIETSILFKPVHLQPIYRKIASGSKDSCPNAEELGERGLALPMFNDISYSQVETVVSAIERIASA